MSACSARAVMRTHQQDQGLSALAMNGALAALAAETRLCGAGSVVALG